MQFIIYYDKRRQRTKQNTCPDLCSLVVCTFLLLFSFVILTISNYFGEPLFPWILPSPLYNFDIKLLYICLLYTSDAADES